MRFDWEFSTWRIAWISGWFVRKEKGLEMMLKFHVLAIGWVNIPLTKIWNGVESLQKGWKWVELNFLTGLFWGEACEIRKAEAKKKKLELLIRKS